MYEYDAMLVRVVDGDTIVVNIDFGMDIWRYNVTLRMSGINAPEMSTPEGVVAKAALTQKLLASDVPGVPIMLRIQTFKMATRPEEQHDDWRRYLALVKTQDGTDVNQWMLDNNYAVPSGMLPA